MTDHTDIPADESPPDGTGGEAMSDEAIRAESIRLARLRLKDAIAQTEAAAAATEAARRERFDAIVAAREKDSTGQPLMTVSEIAGTLGIANVTLHKFVQKRRTA